MMQSPSTPIPTNSEYNDDDLEPEEFERYYSSLLTKFGEGSLESYLRRKYNQDETMFILDLAKELVQKEIRKETHCSNGEKAGNLNNMQVESHGCTETEGILDGRVQTIVGNPWKGTSVSDSLYPGQSEMQIQDIEAAQLGAGESPESILREEGARGRGTLIQPVHVSDATTAAAFASIEPRDGDMGPSCDNLDFGLFGTNCKSGGQVFNKGVLVQSNIKASQSPCGTGISLNHKANEIGARGTAMTKGNSCEVVGSRVLATEVSIEHNCDASAKVFLGSEKEQMRTHSTDFTMHNEGASNHGRSVERSNDGLHQKEKSSSNANEIGGSSFSEAQGFIPSVGQQNRETTDGGEENSDEDYEHNSAQVSSKNGPSKQPPRTANKEAKIDSWAIKLGQNTVGKESLTYIPPTIVQGKPEIHVQTPQFSHLLDLNTQLVVSSFVGRKLPFYYVKEGKAYKIVNSN